MKKIVTIVGARPQFIKAAAISKALRNSDDFSEVMIHTGQHYDAKMSAAFFDELEIPPPRHNLGVGSGGHGPQTGEIMKRLEPILLEDRPDVAIVYGDTNSTMAAALTASKLHIPVAHVEAGLRSFNRRMPEEINRVVADHVSTLLFCPTLTATQNLAAEGITENVFNTGDVMYDVALQFAPRAAQRIAILEELKITRSDYVLATIHRSENTDDPERLAAIFSAFTELAREISVVIPLHPRTRKLLRQFGIAERMEGIKAIDPVGFLDMLALLKNARIVAGWNVLAGTDCSHAIMETIRKSMEVRNDRHDIEEYGDGFASNRIIDSIACFLGLPRKALACVS